MSTLSGLIVRGHGRYMAARLLGCPVPVDYQHYNSTDEELADLIADNRLAELSEVDSKMLADIFTDIDISTLDIEVTGYGKDEYEKIMRALESGLDEQRDNERVDLSDRVASVYEVIVECDNEAVQRKVFETLTEEGYECRVLTL